MWRESAPLSLAAPLWSHLHLSRQLTGIFCCLKRCLCSVVCFSFEVFGFCFNLGLQAGAEGQCWWGFCSHPCLAQLPGVPGDLEQPQPHICSGNLGGDGSGSAVAHPETDGAVMCCQEKQQ